MQQCCYSSEGPWVWDQATVMFYVSHAYNGTDMLVNRLWRKGSGGGRGRSLRNYNAANHVPDGCDSLPDYAAGAFVICFISPSITISHWRAVLPLDSTKELQTLNLFMKWGMCRWKDSLLSYFSKQKTLILSHVWIWVIHKDCHSILNLIIYYTALFGGGGASLTPEPQLRFSTKLGFKMHDSSYRELTIFTSPQSPVWLSAKTA